MRQHMLNFTRLTAATLGACVFWGALGGGFEVMRPNEPHPGLRDGDLKQALRKDRKHDELTYFAARQLLFNQIDGDGRKTSGRYTGEEIARSMGHHRELIQALQAGDADWAGAVMRSHIHAGYRAALRDTGLSGAAGEHTPD